VAQRTVVQLVSDWSGEEIDEGQGRTIVFAYDGAEYSIDLTEEEGEHLDELMGEYISVAAKISGGRRSSRRVSRSGPQGGSPASNGSGAKPDLDAVREWARAQGYEVSDRGRIKGEVMEAFQAAN
jgi:hypothetical protein